MLDPQHLPWKYKLYEPGSIGAACSLTSAGQWSKRNDEAFKALFGSPEGRYPKAAEKSVTLRAPEMSQDSGVPFAAYIHPSNPTKGAYGGFSFVIFPAAEAPCLVGLVVGTQGLAPDEAILGRPGHARKAQAICAWLNKEFGKVNRLRGPSKILRASTLMFLTIYNAMV